METVIELALKFWQYSLLIFLILVGFLINLLDRRIKVKYKFEYDEYPILQPIKIATAGKGFWTMIQIWLFGSRKWKVAKDFKYRLDGESYVIPKGFTCDLASTPKFLHFILSPSGLLMLAGLVHDHAFKHASLLKADKKTTMKLDQKKADEIFLDINLQINGFYLLNKLAFWSLRLAGFAAWNKHRKAEAKK